MTAATLTEGVCRFCGCREETPCEGGCAWTDASRTLCTTCLGAAAIAMELVDALGIVAAVPAARLRVLDSGGWDAFDLEQQRTVVRTCRKYLDAVQLMVAGELGERAMDNGEQLDAILAFLLEHCPEELARVPDAPLAAVVTRLLAPHVGHRILVPGETY